MKKIFGDSLTLWFAWITFRATVDVGPYGRGQDNAQPKRIRIQPVAWNVLTKNKNVFVYESKTSLTDMFAQNRFVSVGDDASASRSHSKQLSAFLRQQKHIESTLVDLSNPKDISHFLMGGIQRAPLSACRRVTEVCTVLFRAIHESPLQIRIYFD